MLEVFWKLPFVQQLPNPIGKIIVSWLNMCLCKDYIIFQRVGDRDKVAYSIKPYAFTIPANPMSDRVQKVIEYVYVEND